MALTVTWNTTFPTTPAGNTSPASGDDKIREFKVAVEERLCRDHVLKASGSYETNDAQGWHRPGSAMCYYQASAPTNLPNAEAALANNAQSNGRLWIDSDNGVVKYWNGTAWTSIAGEDVVGVVKFFHGTWVDNSTISGWYKCDATNASAQGTADLITSNCFIRCNSTSGGTGGAATATLATANLAAHTHTGPSHVHDMYGHTHTFSATSGTGSAHLHYIASTAKSTGAESLSASNYACYWADLGSNVSYLLEGSGTAPTIGRSSSESAHTHSVSGTTGATGHVDTLAAGTGASGSAGSGTAFSILPPYYDLIPIEKRA